MGLTPSKENATVSQKMADRMATFEKAAISRGDAGYANIAKDIAARRGITPKQVVENAAVDVSAFIPQKINQKD